MEITIAYLDEDNIQKSKGKKDVLGATHIWGTKKFKKGPDGWHYVKDADNKERGDDRPNTVCDLDDGDGWRPGPKNLVGKFYQKDGKKWKVVSADLKAGTARCTTGLGKSYESKTADLKELAGEDFEKSVFDEFEPTSDDIEKGVKANIGEIRIWGGKRVRKQSNGKWVEVSEQSLSKKEHENMNFYHDKESNRWRNVEGKNDLRVSHDERKFEHKELASKLSDKEYDESELDIEKSFHKYFKREGTPGNYKYYYNEESYKIAHSAEKVLEGLVKEGKGNSDHALALKVKIQKLELSKEDVDADMESREKAAKQRKHEKWKESEEYKRLEYDIDQHEYQIRDLKRSLREHRMEEEETMADAIKAGHDDPSSYQPYQDWERQEQSILNEISEYEQLIEEIENRLRGSDIQKSITHKYFKREGTPGNYRYYYTEDQYKQAKSGVDKFEIGDIVRIKDGFVSKKTDPLVGLDLKIIKKPQGFYQDPIFRVENVSKKGNGVEVEELHADNLVKYEPKKKDD